MIVPDTMAVWSQQQYGGAEVVTKQQVPVPAPAAGEVLLRVRATALNAADVRIMRGTPLIMRLGFGLRGPRATVQGRDVAGTIIAVGSDVTAHRIGDDVFGEVSGGGLASFVCVPAAKVISRPAALDPLVAASLPMAAGTAWQALDAAGVGTQQASAARVLIIGAGGGVGTFAVALAALRGAQVTTLAGERALPVVQAMGATEALDYRRTDLAALPQGAYDAVLVVAGEPPLRTLRRLLAPGGTAVLIGGGEAHFFGPMGRMLRAGVFSIGSGRKIRSLIALAKPEITTALRDLAVSGELGPHISRTWTLDDARDALAHIDSGHAVGKIVVTVP